jgi:hypothetical protein
MEPAIIKCQPEDRGFYKEGAFRVSPACLSPYPPCITAVVPSSFSTYVIYYLLFGVSTRSIFKCIITTPLYPIPTVPVGFIGHDTEVINPTLIKPTPIFWLRYTFSSSQSEKGLGLTSDTCPTEFMECKGIGLSFFIQTGRIYAETSSNLASVLLRQTVLIV